MSLVPGRFITFEGGDGAGKSTLMDKVYQELSGRGLRVLKTHEPGGTHLGAALRELLLDKKKSAISARTELLLFLADRAQHVDEMIKPALAAGMTVLCDRFNDSTLAYQGGARGFPEDLVRGLCLFASAQLQPHITLYLDIDPKIALKRLPKGTDRIESESLRFHEKIRLAFHMIAQNEPQRFRLIDATPPPEVVFASAMEILNELF